MKTLLMLANKNPINFTYNFVHMIFFCTQNLFCACNFPPPVALVRNSGIKFYYVYEMDS